MIDEAGLLDWARKEQDGALRQIELFGPSGIKAQLVMPDGSTQDITTAVLDHQRSNAPMFERLIATLSRSSWFSSAEPAAAPARTSTRPPI